MKYLGLFIFIILPYCSICQNKTTIDSLDQKAKKFIDEYSPVTVLGSDTFVIPRLPVPDSILNISLFKMASQKDFRLLKYSVLLIHKHCVVLDKAYGSYDMIMSDPSFANNGFVELARVYAKIKVDNSPFQTYIAPWTVCGLDDWFCKHWKPYKSIVIN